MLSNTDRCLQLYLLVTTLGLACQAQIVSSKAGRVTPHISENPYSSFLLYDNDMKKTNETSPLKEKMRTVLETLVKGESPPKNKTKADDSITVIPSLEEELAKHSGLQTNRNSINHTTPGNKLKLSLLKEPISTTVVPAKVTKIAKLYEDELRTTPTSKLTTEKKGKNASGDSKQKAPKVDSASLANAEVIFSQIRNPFQPNGTIEQEVKVISKPSALNDIFRHIHQHMFNHFGGNFGHHHGMRHGHRQHHGGHLFVNRGVDHWPWHMSIQEEHIHGWHHLCHGAMVGHRSVLTNAECVYHKPLPSLRVVRHNLIDKVITLDNSSFITARIIHPKYNDYMNHHYHWGHHHHGGHRAHHLVQHNLVLLHLQHNMGVHPIGIHRYHGFHRHGGGRHCSTAHHNVHFITNQQCDYHFGGEHIENSHVCAYGLPCDIHHHHGSPLVCEHNGYQNLVGLSSYQQSCGHHHPTVYERIAPNTDWITSHIK